MSSTISKTIDGDIDPYITQKHVILCRSGIQYYHKSELKDFITETNKPAVEKTWYREYRDPSVIVKAQDLCSSLPVTKEHPSDWVTSKNWKQLAGGTTDKEVKVVALDGASDGDIGLESSITFYDQDLYEYYKKYKETSLGYLSKKHFVDNPEELGYDIVLDEIVEVNHLAIVRNGRGGPSVAVIDNLIGGLKPMRTGIFSFIANKRQKDSAPLSFGEKVFKAIDASKGTTKEELEKEMTPVLDSCAELKDCTAKETLKNIVRDCFDNKDQAKTNRQEISKVLDSMYVSISGDSLSDIVSACASLKTPSPVVVSDSTDKKTDVKSADKSDKKDKKDKKDDKDDKDCYGKKTTDSVTEKDNIISAVKDSIKPAVEEAVKESLKANITGMVKDSVKEILGIQKDSKPSGLVSDTDATTVATRDYASFLEE